MTGPSLFSEAWRLTMAGMDNSATGVTSGKAQWRSPKLQELGNLRSFVQSGNAFGKSGTIADGCSDPAGEKMDMGECM